MKITYNIEEIADIIRERAQVDLVKVKGAGEVETEYVDDGRGGQELQSMTVEMED